MINRYGSQRNYRFFGDILPDGAPCGTNKYCLGGECLVSFSNLFNNMLQTNVRR